MLMFFRLNLRAGNMTLSPDVNNKLASELLIAKGYRWQLKTSLGFRREG